jgi:cardiolipin synthase
LLVLWSPHAGAQSADGLRGAVPQSVRVLEEVIEQLTDAPLDRDNAVELLLDGPHLFGAMLEDAGVVVREFSPPDPVQDQNPFDIDTRDHRKLLIVDARAALTGGINIDRNYVRPSDVVGRQSANAVILGADFAAELEDVFLADLENSIRIDAEQWRDRSLWQRTKELGAYFIRYRL